MSLLNGRVNRCCIFPIICCCWWLWPDDRYLWCIWYYALLFITILLITWLETTFQILFIWDHTRGGFGPNLIWSRIKLLPRLRYIYYVDKQVKLINIMLPCREITFLLSTSTHLEFYPRYFIISTACKHYTNVLDLQAALNKTWRLDQKSFPKPDTRNY